MKIQRSFTNKKVVRERKKKLWVVFAALKAESHQYNALWKIVRYVFATSYIITFYGSIVSSFVLCSGRSGCPCTVYNAYIREKRICLNVRDTQQ